MVFVRNCSLNSSVQSDSTCSPCDHLASSFREESLEDGPPLSKWLVQGVIS